jgi:hypothetical protein
LESIFYLQLALPLCGEEECLKAAKCDSPAFLARVGTSPIKVCSGCHKVSENALKTCGRCHIPVYCSSGCQRSHWEYHRDVVAAKEKDDGEGHGESRDQSGRNMI